MFENNNELIKMNIYPKIMFNKKTIIQCNIY